MSGGREVLELVVGLGGKPPGLFRGIVRITGGTIDVLDSGRFQGCCQVVRRICKLGEEDEFLRESVHFEKPDEGLQLVVCGRRDFPRVGEQTAQSGGILFEVGEQGFLEDIGPQPLVALGLVARDGLVNRLGFRAVVGFVPLSERWELLLAILQIELTIAKVVQAGVEKGRILLADRQREFVLEGVDLDVIAEDVAMDAEEECVRRTLQALEEIGAAEAFHAFACTREVVEDLLFRRTYVRRQNILFVETAPVAGEI